LKLIDHSKDIEILEYLIMPSDEVERAKIGEAMKNFRVHIELSLFYN